MTDMIGIMAASMHADADALRVISQNITNAQSIGYQREILVTRDAFERALATSAPGIEGNSSPGGVAVDMRPGTLKSTGEPLDLAIEGSGFFVIGRPAGEHLTRRGDFRVDSQGQLVTQAGDAVLGQRGAIVLSGQSPSIDADGTVRVADQIIDRLRIADVDNPSALVPAGEGAYRLSADGQMIESTTGRIQQGYLETSNVQPTNEMVQLMETLRRFEASQRFVRGYDEMTDKAISTLGKI